MREAAGAEFDAAALLAQGAWLRRLGRELARDEAAAEELAQEAFATALERRPVAGPGLGAWLAGVARNVARRRASREAQRRAVERRGARDEAVDGGQDGVARLEVQRIVADAVLALDEPYRTAVLLRHQDGLGAAEIARRTGSTPAAVRQRVARGLATLRARLDRRFGERGSWCAVFVAACGVARPDAAVAHGATTVGITGGAVMVSKLAVAVGVIACVAGAAWLVAPAVLRWAATERAESAADALAGSRASSVEEVRVAGDAPALRESAAGDRATDARRSVAATARDAAPTVAFVRGRVVDRAGLAIAGAQVATLGEDRAVLAEATCDAAGRFELDAAGASLVHATHGAYLPADAAWPGDAPLELALAARPVIEVRLLDAAGSPASGAGWVRATVLPTGETRDRGIELALGTDGVWRSSGAPVGQLLGVAARVRGFAATRLAIERELAPDGRVPVAVELSGGRALRGRIVDSSSRSPIAGALVWAEVHTVSETDASPRAETAADGSFTLTGVEPAEGMDALGAGMQLFWLGASAEGYASLSYHGLAVAVSDPAPHAELALDAATASLELRVSRADGSPAAGFWAMGSDPRRNLLVEIADGDGVLRFDELASGPVDVGIHAGAHGDGDDPAFASVSVDLVPGEHRRMDVVLGAPATLTGRLLDPDGQPLAGVHLLAHFEHHTRSLGFPLGQETLVTAKDGTFRTDAAPASSVRFELADASGALCLEPPQPVVQLVAGAAAHFDLVAAPGITIAGTVRVDPTREVAWRLRLVDPASGEELESMTASIQAAFSFGPHYPRALELVLERDGATPERVEVGPSGANGLELGP